MDIVEIIFSGFVSKAINNCVDISWDKIKKAVKDKNHKQHNLESQIYNVIVNTLNELTKNLYKNSQSIIYDAAESLLKIFRESSVVELENIISCLKKFFLHIDENRCKDFKVLLYEELGKDEYSELFHTILLLLLEQKNQYDYEVMKQLNQKLDQVILIINQKKDDDENNSMPNARQKVKSRTQEYADKWNANMFLNDFDEWDENAGVNIKLSDVYIEDHLPHFIWGQNKEESNNLDKLLNKYIGGKSNESKMLLILGQPGIGKSTLITWITAKFKEDVKDILVYQFASDLKNVDWRSSNISNEILDALNLSYDDLQGKTLIFDGFDEVSVGGDRRGILDQLYDNLIYKKNTNNFKLIITCRENYIYGFERIKCQYITLLTWDKDQIQSFSTIFQAKTNDVISEHTMAQVIKNKQILGIPLILYMVLALNIAIEKEGSIVDIYDKIFSLEGGIYDRCIDNKKFADNHRISEIKEQIHQISREIAIWMFENEPDKAYIPHKNFEKICDGVINEKGQNDPDIKQDILIGNYFKIVKHCEGVETEELYFVHRSIYEYFVAETIYNSIEESIKELTELSKKKMAGNIAFLLKEGKISHIIGEFLLHKIENLYYKLDNTKQYKFIPWWEKTINMMMEFGMFYFTTDKIIHQKNMISKEVRCFLNLIKISQVLMKFHKNKNILLNVKAEYVERYVKYCIADRVRGVFDISYLYLEKRNFRGADLNGAILTGINLYLADLLGANLARVNLKNAELRNANLKFVNFRGADLSGANLRSADLEGADLREVSLENSELFDAFLEDTIWGETGIRQQRFKLRKTRFTKIKIEEVDGLRDVYRSELFSM